MKRGDIWWAEFPAPIKRRPVVLLSRNTSYTVRDLVLVSPLTRTVRHIPTEVSLGRHDGMPHACVINLDVIYTISKTLLRTKITELSSQKIRALEKALCFAVGIG